MLSRIYKWPLIFAIILHLSLFTFLFVKFAHHASYSVPSSVKIIQAVVVNQTQVNKQLQAITEQKRKQREAELAKIRQIKAQKAAAEKRKLAAVKKVKAEKLAKQKAIAAKKQREIAIKKQKQLAEKKKQEALKQKQISAKKQIDAKKAKALAEQKQVAMQQNMQKQLVAEQQQMVAAQQMQGQVDKYKALILQAIQSYWIPPPNLPQGIFCKLLVSVAPGGEVLSVQMIQSSGNVALDRSAKTAVLKASPLPVPKDADLFDNFRTIRLTVRPEGVF